MKGCEAYVAIKQKMMQPTASIKDRLTLNILVPLKSPRHNEQWVGEWLFHIFLVFFYIDFTVIK